MELKLIYRALRGVSDITLDQFYSEVHVEGQHSFPKDGPLVVAATHANEIIDMASLAATAPHRRMLSAWAKSTMFKNPVGRYIMLSSGSIPVQRNPDSAAGKTAHGALFDETSLALANGQSILIFPEGTSYTDHTTAEFREGAGWAALEFAEWQENQHSSSKELSIIPVAVVYTSKSQYLSRVIVKYGEPIPIGSLHREATDDPSRRVVVKKLMAEVRNHIIESTINAPDWNTLYASEMAREMLWAHRPLKLQDFVPVSQILVHLLSQHESQLPSLADARRTLTVYLGLLHYTKTSHATLSSLYPEAAGPPSTSRALLSLFRQTVSTLLHPQFILFLPVLAPHILGYITGTLAAKHIAKPDEQEGQAQFKVIFGGVGLLPGYAATALSVISWLLKVADAPNQKLPLWEWVARLVSWGSTASTKAGLPASWTSTAGGRIAEILRTIGGRLKGSEGTLSRLLCYGAVFYGTSWLLAKWHKKLVGGNYQQFRKIVASYRILRGVASPTSQNITTSQLEPYSRPPPAPINRFLKKKFATGTNTPTASTASSSGLSSPTDAPRIAPPPVDPRRLVQHLFAARRDATVALGGFLQEVQSRKDNGSVIMEEGLEKFAPLLSGLNAARTSVSAGSQLVEVLYSKGGAL